jgi:very-short-patch-repair endonuclease
MSHLEDQFVMILRCFKDIPPPAREHRFHPTRRWRFDFAWVEQRLAIEIEGGLWRGGRHQTATGYRADCEKYNAATLLGWRVLRLTDRDLANPRQVVDLIRQALNEEVADADL